MRHLVNIRKLRDSRTTIILSAVVMLVWSLSLWVAWHHEETHEKNYFQFVIPEHYTTRQSGQLVDIYVRYAYTKNLPTNKYPDYKALRTDILKYMEPSDEFPAQVYWEIITTQMGKELMHNFPLEGVSIQLIVADNQNPRGYEPGNHGPIYTLGNIAPLDIY